jgi:hypothetical protein
MIEPYVQSITISMPSQLVNGERSGLSSLFKNNKWGNYFKYQTISYILIDLRNFVPSCSIYSQITPLFNHLQLIGIVSPDFTFEHIKIHEIKLRFDIDIPGAVYCDTKYFLKVDNITYRSDDTRQKRRKNKDPNKNSLSKGRQQSFLTVKQYDKKGSSVIFVFSGKYAKQLSTDNLSLNYNALIDSLCSLGSIYITQATNPDGLKIGRGYMPFIHKRFQQMLTEANWFNGKYIKKRVTSK